MLNKEKGFIGLDLTISILIIIAFTSIMATIIYNTYLASTAIKRKAEATGYVVEVLEKANISYYQDLTTDDDGNTNNLVAYFNSQYANRGISNIVSANNLTNADSMNTRYRIIINIVQYKKNEGYLDLIKQITVTAKYYVRSKEQVVQISTIKEKENLITPNAPSLENNIIPVKYIKDTNSWEIASKDDPLWYNYEEGIWAGAILENENYTSSTPIGTKITGEPSIIWWIPSYAYNGTDIEFLYSTSSECVDENGELQALDGYTSEFSNERGRWCSDTSLSEYTILNSSIYINKLNT